MTEIASHAGVSVRRLQLVFRSVAGCTPHEALNLTRMEAARRYLQRPAGQRSVTEIALDCGFSHISRFSAAYRAFYGESPNQTFRKRASC